VTGPRQLAAHHDPAVLASPHLTAAFAIHRAAPALSLMELLEHAVHSGPASRAIEHANECGQCRLSALCPDGARLTRAIGQRRSRRRPAA
jgi:hypothetical protein